VLTISRWLTWAAATAYDEHFAKAWREGGVRRLDAVWFDVLASCYGSRRRPIDGVLEEFQRRWRQVLAHTPRDAAGEYDPAAFRSGVERLFAAPRHGWRSGAVHSPDIQLCARSAVGVGSGDYRIVLGEVHVGSPTITGPVFEWPFDRYAVSTFLGSRLGPRHVPVFPESWPRNTGRTKPFQSVPGDVLYAFADVEGAPAATMSITEISVTAEDGAAVVILPDGARVAFAEFFAFFLSSTVIDAWKHLATGPHTQRVSVGGVTVLREAWRVDLREAVFPHPKGELDRYRATVSWQRSLGLPDTVYVSVGGEAKPFYVDFRSPVSVLSFVTTVRAALRDARGPVELKISEGLPGPEEAWVVDAHGDRYFGEIRMMLVDGRAL
jgi:hypothetical protein